MNQPIMGCSRPDRLAVDSFPPPRERGPACRTAEGVHHLMKALRLTLVAALVLAVGSAAAGNDDPPADARPYEDQVRPFLARHCRECHGVEKPKGNFRLDRLTPDFADEANRERWLTVLKRVKAGEMPPKPKPRPPEKEVQLLSDWIGKGAEAASARGTQGRTVLRRLNRVEYQNTVRDLLGVDVDLLEMLPPDTQAFGFDNVGEALHVSSFLMEKYLEAADTALNVAIANGPKPPTVKK